MQTERKAQELWSNRGVFILALLGSSIGLGNIWRFPHLINEQGGGAFILIYLLCVVGIGVPMVMAEVLIGRHSRNNPAQAIKKLSEESGASVHWQWLGYLSILTGALVFAFYAVVAAWIFYYLFSLTTGSLIDVGWSQSNDFFTQMLINPDALMTSHSVFMLLVLLILGAGVRRGLDRAVRYLVPLMLLLLLILLIYAAQTGRFLEAYQLLFSIRPEQVTQEVVLSALSHAFFTLSIGMGVMITYGSYLSRKESIGQAVVCVGVMDTLLALVVAMVIFPILLAVNMEPDAGPRLLFITMPVAMGQLQAGQVLLVLFFMLVGVAAVTSAIALMEPMTAWLEQAFGYRRLKSALIAVGSVWCISLAVLFSFSALADVTLLRMNLFEQLSALTTYVLIPLVALGMMLFVGWVLIRRMTQDQLALSLVGYYLWRFSIRYLAPLVIGLIFVTNLYNVSF